MLEFFMDVPVNKFRVAFIENSVPSPEECATELLTEVFSEEALKCCCLLGSDTQPQLSVDGIEAVMGEKLQICFFLHDTQKHGI
jgi:hypothetical protein